MKDLHYYPIYVAGGLFLLLMIFTPRSGLLASKDITRRLLRLKSGGVVIAMLLLAAYVFMVFYYLLAPTYYDHIEPAVASCAHIIQSGNPLYHDLNAAQRYSMLYGPALYLAYSGAMWLLPFGLFSCKLLAALTAFATVSFAALSLGKSIKGRALVIVMGILAALLLMHAPKISWVRADPLICACVACALWAATNLKPNTAAAVIGLVLGIAANMKVNAPVYFVLPLLLLFRRSGVRPVFFGLSGAMLIAVVPFLLPNISFHNWWRILRVAGSHGLGATEINQSCQWFIYLSAPLATVWLVAHRAGVKLSLRQPGSVGQTVAVLFVSLVATAGFAAKAGSDPTHFVPIIPLVIYAICLIGRDLSPAALLEMFTQRKWLQALAAALLISATILAGHSLAGSVLTIREQIPYSRSVYSDLARIMANFPQRTICMGAGLDVSEFTADHFLPLVQAGNPYLISPVALMEFEKAGLPLPQATRDIISHEKVDIWLIPKCDPPFAIANPYPPNHDLFDLAFRSSFASHYRRIGTSSFFDIYVRNGLLNDPSTN